MPFLDALAQTFQVTPFDAGLLVFALLAILLLYYFVSLHQIFEAAFGAIIGLGIYILLSVILLGNPTLSTEGGLFPLGFSVFLVSIAVYLVFILAVLFPLHGGLIISEPTHPTLYTGIFVLVSAFLLFSLGAVMIYMTEQSYVFHVGNIFTWFRDGAMYQEIVRKSSYYSYVMSHQNMIIPLGVVLMLYKLLLSNLINAALLSIWYNLANVGFYRKKEDASYRVEFHEVGGSGGHGDAH
jgi:hypothetical protein